MRRKIISLILCFSFLFTQSGFAQGVLELNLGQYLGQMKNNLAVDKFRPLHLRYLSYDLTTDNFQLLLDKGDNPDIKDQELEDQTKVLMEYFQIGLALPNDKFWVNLRPDAEDQIIEPELEKTDLGKVMLEADLQLKRDTANWTSPQTPEGRLYWDKLYQKAKELFGKEPANIPTITRPWIVPGEIIVREGEASAYIFKANLKVMLEEDYLSSQPSAISSQQYNFKDSRMKELNTYSTQLIRELIIPKLTKEVNTAKRYDGLRQVFFSLVLARWFKERFGKPVSQLASKPVNPLTGKPANLSQLIDSGNLAGLTSKEPWSKTFYFNEYKQSFAKGEYNLKENLTTPSGQVIRSYVSGGTNFTGVGSPLIKDGFRIVKEAFGDMGRYYWNNIKGPGEQVLMVGELLGPGLSKLSIIPYSSLRDFLLVDKKATKVVNEFKESIGKIFDDNTYTKMTRIGKKIFLNFFEKNYEGPKEALTAINAAFKWLKEESITFRPLWRSITPLSEEEKQKKALIEAAFLKAEKQLVDALYGASPLSVEEDATSIVNEFKLTINTIFKDHPNALTPEQKNEITSKLESKKSYENLEEARKDLKEIVGWLAKLIYNPWTEWKIKEIKSKIEQVLEKGEDEFEILSFQPPFLSFDRLGLKAVDIEEFRKDAEEFEEFFKEEEIVKNFIDKWLSFYPGSRQEKIRDKLKQILDPNESENKKEELLNVRDLLFKEIILAHTTSETLEALGFKEVAPGSGYYLSPLGLWLVVTKAGEKERIEYIIPTEIPTKRSSLREVIKDASSKGKEIVKDSGIYRRKIEDKDTIIIYDKTSQEILFDGYPDQSKHYPIDSETKVTGFTLYYSDSRWLSSTLQVEGQYGKFEINEVGVLPYSMELDPTKQVSLATPESKSSLREVIKEEGFQIGGVNDNKVIQNLKSLTGLPIEEIEKQAHPGQFSQDGFLGQKESLIERLLIDNEFVRSKGFTHQQLAEPLFYMMGLLKFLKTSSIKELKYKGGRYRIWSKAYLGEQESIFKDGLSTYVDYIVVNLKNRKRITFPGLLPEYIWRYGFYEGNTLYRLDPEKIIDVFFADKEETTSGYTPKAKIESSNSPLMPGGIDFRSMQMLIQPMGSFSNLTLTLPTLSSSALERIDLNKELVSLRQMASSGIVPSGQRVKEYEAALFQKGRFEEKQDDLLLCLAEIYLLAEKENINTGPELQESLVIADTGRFVLLPNNQKVGVN